MPHTRGSMRCEACPDLLLDPGESLDNRLAISSPARLKGSRETPLHRIRSRPLLQVVSLDFVADIDIGQKSKCALKSHQEVVQVEWGLWRASHLGVVVLAL